MQQISLQRLCWKFPSPVPLLSLLLHSSFLHGATDVLEGAGTHPFLARQAPHVNSLNKCSHFSQLIHPHVHVLKLCQTLNAANSPTVHHSWRWNCSSPLSAFPLSLLLPSCLFWISWPSFLTGAWLRTSQKSNPGRALKETLESKGHYKVILSWGKLHFPLEVDFSLQSLWIFRLKSFSLIGLHSSWDPQRSFQSTSRHK